MRGFIDKVEKSEHLTYEEMVAASKLLFAENTEVHYIVDFLKALSKKERLLLRLQHLQQL